MTYSAKQLKAMCPAQISECSQKHVQSVIEELIETALAQPASVPAVQSSAEGDDLAAFEDALRANGLATDDVWKRAAYLTMFRAGRAANVQPKGTGTLNLSDPAVQRRLAAQWGYIQAPAPAQGTVLPDGSAFMVGSLPLPTDHWLYAERIYMDGHDDPVELPTPVTTHADRDRVEAAIRYAVRGATMCGKEMDFDPDALVQNAVYALCGPFGGRTIVEPAQPEKPSPAVPHEDGGKF